MVKEKILNLGLDLSESQVLELTEMLKGELENYVTKEDYEKLKVENEELEKLKEEKALQESEHLSFINKLKIENAVDLAVNKVGGKNLKAIKALIDFENISIDEVGEIVGLDEQIEKLTEGENSQFLFEDKNEISIKGATPVTSEKTQSISKEDFEKMSYKDRLAIYNQDQELYKALSC